MANANKRYLDGSVAAPDHPRIRAWRSFRREPGVDHVVVEVRRERDALTLLPPRFFVSFMRRDGTLARFDEAPWEAVLENWLTDEERARSLSDDNAKIRFGLLLKPEFRTALVRYGDGYFNSVLVWDLRGGPYQDQADLAAMLKAISVPRPSGDFLADCEQLIDAAIRKVGTRLLLVQPERRLADEILAGALAHYLDERFSITSGKMLWG
jgi:hypothetical protein